MKVDGRKPAEENCRLLYLIGSLSAGGTERQLSYLLQSIERKRYRPELVVWSLGESQAFVPQIRNLGIRLHSFPCASSARQKLFEFCRLVLRINPEVVHSYSFYTNFSAWWATVSTGHIVVGSSRSNITWEKNTTGPLLGPLECTVAPLSNLQQFFCGEHHSPFTFPIRS